MTILSCHKCEYKIDDVYELDAHRWKEHEDDEPDTNINTVEEERVSENKLGLSCAKLSCQMRFCCTVINICCLILIDMK